MSESGETAIGAFFNGSIVDITGARVGKSETNVRALDTLNIENSILLGPVTVSVGRANRVVISTLSSERPQGSFTLQIKESLSELILDGVSQSPITISGTGSVDKVTIKGALTELTIRNLAAVRRIEIASQLGTLVIHDVGEIQTLDASATSFSRFLVTRCTLRSSLRLCGDTAEHNSRAKALQFEHLRLNRAKVEVSDYQVAYLSMQGCRLSEQSSIRLDRVTAELVNWSFVQCFEDSWIEFHATPLAKSYFGGTDLKCVRFGLDIWEPTRTGTKLLVDDRLRGNSDGVQLFPQAFVTGEKVVATGHALDLNLECYRRLIKYYEDRREFALAEMFHIGEMEMLRWRPSVKIGNRTWAWVVRNVSALGIYRLISQYGTSYRQAALAILITWLGFSLAFLWAGLGCRDVHHSCVAIQYDILPTSLSAIPSAGAWLADLSRAMVHTLEIATLQKDTAFSPIGSASRILRAVGPVVFAGEVALFLFALRRRLRRSANLSG